MLESKLAIAAFGLALVLSIFGAPPAAAQPRSAQSDCSRAVSSRGYLVTSSGNFRQQPDGWTLDMQAKSPRGQLTSGSCHVNTATGAVTLRGFGGAFDNAGGGSRLSFDCLSKDRKYQECQLPVDGRARLVKRLTDARCDENVSWGQRGDRVWVTKGCKGRFEVIPEAVGGGGQFFDCRSTDGRYRECRVPGGGNARLVRVHAGNCRQDSTWGLRPGQVWVTMGCQAQFAAGQGGGGPGGGGVDNAVKIKAEQACMASAKRAGYTVYGQSAAVPQGNALRVGLKLKQGSQLLAADCYYDRSNGQTRLEQVRPQPR